MRYVKCDVCGKEIPLRVGMELAGIEVTYRDLATLLREKVDVCGWDCLLKWGESEKAKEAAYDDMQRKRFLATVGA